MACCTKIPAACRVSSESCNCCTCSTSLAEVCPSCTATHLHHLEPHRHEGCSCVHPLIICACSSCSSEDKESCHGHHANQPAAQPTEKF